MEVFQRGDGEGMAADLGFLNVHPRHSATLQSLVTSKGQTLGVATTHSAARGFWGTTVLHDLEPSPPQIQTSKDAPRTRQAIPHPPPPSTTSFAVDIENLSGRSPS